ncbi:hypothetical protein HK105_209168 [Polyrhizophydium stewartii]|uniref:Uncharacterized protein n=1 Tax=Polyrhizophydium stewartii TaxID=2732419 RepID=A0ABR4MVT4_9FUNG
MPTSTQPRAAAASTTTQGHAEKAASKRKRTTVAHDQAAPHTAQAAGAAQPANTRKRAAPAHDQAAAPKRQMTATAPQPVALAPARAMRGRSAAAAPPVEAPAAKKPAAARRAPLALVANKRPEDSRGSNLASTRPGNETLAPSPVAPPPAAPPTAVAAEPVAQTQAPERLAQPPPPSPAAASEASQPKLPLHDMSPRDPGGPSTISGNTGILASPRLIEKRQRDDTPNNNADPASSSATDGEPAISEVLSWTTIRHNFVLRPDPDLIRRVAVIESKRRRVCCQPDTGVEFEDDPPVQSTEGDNGIRTLAPGQDILSEGFTQYCELGIFVRIVYPEQPTGGYFRGFRLNNPSLDVFENALDYPLVQVHDLSPTEFRNYERRILIVLEALVEVMFNRFEIPPNSFNDRYARRFFNFFFRTKSAIIPETITVGQALAFAVMAGFYHRDFARLLYFKQWEDQDSFAPVWTMPTRDHPSLGETRLNQVCQNEPGVKCACLPATEYETPGNIMRLRWIPGQMQDFVQVLREAKFFDDLAKTEARAAAQAASNASIGAGTASAAPSEEGPTDMNVDNPGSGETQAGGEPNSQAGYDPMDIDDTDRNEQRFFDPVLGAREVSGRSVFAVINSNDSDSLEERRRHIRLVQHMKMQDVNSLPRERFTEVCGFATDFAVKILHNCQVNPDPAKFCSALKYLETLLRAKYTDDVTLRDVLHSFLLDALGLDFCICENIRVGFPKDVNRNIHLEFLSTITDPHHLAHAICAVVDGHDFSHSQWQKLRLTISFFFSETASAERSDNDDHDDHDNHDDHDDHDDNDDNDNHDDNENDHGDGRSTAQADFG